MLKPTVAILTFFRLGAAVAQPPLIDVPSTTPSPPPRIEFNETEFDFGRISDRTEVAHKFWFKNTGRGELIWKPEQKMTGGLPFRPKASTGVDRFEFAPGEEGYFEIRYNTHGKRGDIHQRVTLQTNDPAHYPEGPVLSIKAHITPVISFDPPSIEFGQLLPGEASTRTLRVIGTAPNFRVNYLSTSKGRFISSRIVESSPTDMEGEPAWATTIELRLNAVNLSAGPMQAVGTVRTSDPTLLLADFPIGATIEGDLKVLPRRLSLGVLDYGDWVARSFVVTSRTGKPFKILKAASQNWIEVTVTPEDSDSGPAFRLSIGGTLNADKGAFRRPIKVLTDSPTSPEIEVLMTGYVRNRAQ